LLNITAKQSLTDLRMHYYHWVDTSDGGLLVPEGIIRPVISVATLKLCN